MGGKNFQPREFFRSGSKAKEGKENKLGLQSHTRISTIGGVALGWGWAGPSHNLFP